MVRSDKAKSRSFFFSAAGFGEEVFIRVDRRPGCWMFNYQSKNHPEMCRYLADFLDCSQNRG